MTDLPALPILTYASSDPVSAITVAPELNFGLWLSIAFLVSFAMLLVQALKSAHFAGLGSNPVVHHANHHPLPGHP